MSVPLSQLKESNAVQVVLFLKSFGLEDKQAFQWWVLYTLRKADRIIYFIKARVKVTTHKYGMYGNSYQHQVY